jgi:hypothetical protein
LIVTGVTMIGLALALRDVAEQAKHTFERPAKTPTTKPVAHG